MKDVKVEVVFRVPDEVPVDEITGFVNDAMADACHDENEDPQLTQSADWFVMDAVATVEGA